MGALLTFAAIVEFYFDDEDDPLDLPTEFNIFLRENFGEKWSQPIQSGVVDPITGATISSRVGLGANQMLFREPPPGTNEAREMWEYYVGTALGAAIKIPWSMSFGLDKLRRDDPAWLESMVPGFMRHFLKARRYANEGVNQGEDTVVSKDDISVQDIITQAVGFSPRIVSQAWTERMAIKNYIAAVQDRRRILKARIKNANESGDQKRIDKAMEAWNTFKSKHDYLEDFGVSLDKRLGKTIGGQEYYELPKYLESNVRRIAGGQ